MSQTNRKALEQLVRLPGNNVCAECGKEDPDWASCSLGVFVCEICASLHRSLGSHVSRIRSLSLDNWDDASIILMSDMGNIKARDIYEKHVPFFWPMVTQFDCPVLKEQWIRAKYERKEFVEPSDRSAAFTRAFMDGYLHKKGKDVGRFERRKFQLTQQGSSFVLKYYNDQAEMTPKNVMRITDINANLSPEKVHPNGMHITYHTREGPTRSIFVYSDNGKDIVDWFIGIRAAKLHTLCLANPLTHMRQLSRHLTQAFGYEGYLYKTPPKLGSAYQRRYFVLEGNRLMYSADPLDALPKGEILIGSREEGYGVKGRIPLGIPEKGFGFILLCPARTWVLGAETEEDRDMWLTRLHEVIYSTRSEFSP